MGKGDNRRGDTGEQGAHRIRRSIFWQDLCGDIRKCHKKVGTKVKKGRCCVPWVLEARDYHAI